MAFATQHTSHKTNIKPYPGDIHLVRLKYPTVNFLLLNDRRALYTSFAHFNSLSLRWTRRIFHDPRFRMSTLFDLDSDSKYCCQL